jgi:flagellar hook protein FlgE
VDVQANFDSRSTEPTVAWPSGGFDAFDSPPTAPDPDMYNASTSLTIYDSLGNAHVQSMYFVKTANDNEWDIHTLIDGVTVSGPDTVPFTSSGQLDPDDLPMEIAISGWEPLNSLGDPTGADTADLVLDLSGLTQFGNEFSVNNMSQDGYTTGQLRGVEVGDTGIVFTRFTNGQSRALGQIALANFSNTAGLQPLGSTAWAETFASGQPAIGGPGTAGLGTVQSGALEDSNVEVTQQLVDMIVAQRNFQANAKVIQTEDTITQAVINLR